MGTATMFQLLIQKNTIPEWPMIAITRRLETSVGTKSTFGTHMCTGTYPGGTHFRGNILQWYE